MLLLLLLARQKCNLFAIHIFMLFFYINIQHTKRQDSSQYQTWQYVSYNHLHPRPKITSSFLRVPTWSPSSLLVINGNKIEMRFIMKK